MGGEHQLSHAKYVVLLDLMTNLRPHIQWWQAGRLVWKSTVSPGISLIVIFDRWDCYS